MKRILEPEAMDTMDEALAYDRMIKLYSFYINGPFVKKISKIIKRKTKKNGSLSVLDIGCGTGRIPIGIAKRVEESTRIYAIDISKNMLEVAERNAKYEGVDKKIVFRQADGKKLDFKENTFDLVMCSIMLHHLADPAGLLSEMKRVAKNNGTVVVRDVIRLPSKLILNLFVNIFGSLAGTLMKNDYRASLLAGFAVKEYKEMMGSAGLTPVKVFLQFPHYITLVNERNQRLL
jgi:ubiquinone/menaquinone biosynthesis C-methylase UbiE